MKATLEIHSLSEPREADVIAWNAKERRWEAVTRTDFLKPMIERFAENERQIEALKAENAKARKQINTLAKALGGIEL